MSVIDPKKAGIEYFYSGPTGMNSNIVGSSGGGFRIVTYTWQGTRSGVFSLPQSVSNGKSMELAMITVWVGSSAGGPAVVSAVDVQIRTDVTDTTSNTSGTELATISAIPITANTGSGFYRFTDRYAVSSGTTISVFMRDNTAGGVTGDEYGAQLTFRLKQ